MLIRNNPEPTVAPISCTDLRSRINDFLSSRYGQLTWYQQDPAVNPEKITVILSAVTVDGATPLNYYLLTVGTEDHFLASKPHTSLYTLQELNIILDTMIIERDTRQFWL